MNRKLIFSFLIALMTLGIKAQTSSAPTTLEGWADRLQKFGKSIPQEQIFIHLDNNCYFLGDTLYYKAYVRRSDNGAPSNLSGVLYAELLNQDGYLVERQLIEMKNGQGNGSFCLLDTLYGGYYELRAYTRWQLNWGEYQHPHTKAAEKWFYNSKFAHDYYRDYEKLYSRVFPVYDKPSKEGDFVHDMTLRPLRRHFKSKDAKPEAVMKFFPEGGSLIAGALNRVAFEINDDEGQHLEGTLSVTDDKGNKVAEAKTELRGRGTVEFTPVAGASYTAQFTWKDGTQKDKLPEVEADGCALRVEQNAGTIEVKVEARGQAANEELGLTVMNQGVMQKFTQLGKGANLSTSLNANEFPTGVLQLTIYNAQGRIYADRLIFVRQSDFKAENLTFTGLDAKNVEPYAQVKLGVQGGKGGSTISVAVHDAAHSEYIYDSGNILTEMLLSSQIRGFVENPEYFFEKDDTEHQRALDLLLMIQGWRRYDWYTMATPGAFVLNHMPEKTQRFVGSVNNYQSVRQEDRFSVADSEIEKAMQTDTETEAQKSDSSSKLNAAASNSGEEMGDVGAEMEAMRKDAEANFKYRQTNNAQKSTTLFNAKESNLKREVLVHAEFVKPGEEGVVGEMMSEKGTFTLEAPRFFEKCYLYLGASDSTKWKDGKAYDWVSNGEDKDERVEYPEFYVKLNPIYPRFVKPYNWYQSHLAEIPEGTAMAQEATEDGVRTLDMVTVKARRNGMSRFNPNKPAFVVDAYQAFNEACDAGLNTSVFTGSESLAYNVARTYIGDMNTDRSYPLEFRFDTRNASTSMSDAERNRYTHLPYLDKVYIYTDYSPRREGDKKYEASNQPEVTVDLRLLENGNGARRATYRDRRYVLQGFSVCEDFYQPDYSQKPLPEHKDYRRTLYWNPNLKLDDSGNAQFQFYNNGQKTQLSVSAEGMSSAGELLTGQSMPESR